MRGRGTWPEPAAILCNQQIYCSLPQPPSRSLWVEGVLETALESQAFVFYLYDLVSRQHVAGCMLR